MEPIKNVIDLATDLAWLAINIALLVLIVLLARNTWVISNTLRKPKQETACQKIMSWSTEDDVIRRCGRLVVPGTDRCPMHKKD